MKLTPCKLTRRSFLTSAGPAALCGVSLPGPATQTVPRPSGSLAASFRYCLNTGTLRGFKLGLVEQIEIAAKAGYAAIEPWISDLEKYAQGQGSPAELRRRIEDLGLTVENAIAFASWIVEDVAERTAGLEAAKRSMDLLARIGGRRMAAPPSGATKPPTLDLRVVAERYRVLLEAGDQAGVVPALEFWGTSANLRLLSEAVCVAVESGHPSACVLPDVYHMYKGGSSFAGLHLLGRSAVPVTHMNDYPADPPREQIADRHRVFPGDGIAPLKQVMADLAAINPGMVLSLEVFNPDYWKRDALEVARLGLEKMRLAAA